jgi:hypothetical protein
MTPEKRGRVGSCSYRFAEDQVILIFFKGCESINKCWSTRLEVLLEFDIDLVFLVGIGWYFPCTHHTDTKGKIGW